MASAVDAQQQSATAAGSSTAPRPRIYLSGGRFLVWDPRQIFELRCSYRLVGTLVGPLPGKNRQAADHGPPLSLLFEEALLAVEEGFADVVDGRLPEPECDDAPSGDDAPAGSASASDDAGLAALTADERVFRAIPTRCAELDGRDLPPLPPSRLRLAGAGRLIHAQVFRELWGRGFFVTAGATFGADYLWCARLIRRAPLHCTQAGVSPRLSHAWPRPPRVYLRSRTRSYPGDPIIYHAHLLVHVRPPGRPLKPLELVAASRMAGSVKKTAVLAEPVGTAAVRFLSLTPQLGGPGVVGTGRAGRYARTKK